MRWKNASKISIEDTDYREECETSYLMISAKERMVRNANEWLFGWGYKLNRVLSDLLMDNVCIVIVLCLSAGITRFFSSKIRSQITLLLSIFQGECYLQ